MSQSLGHKRAGNENDVSVQWTERRKLWLAVGVVVIAITIVIAVAWRELREPQFIPYGDLPEPPLPADPVNAELVIRDRMVRDRLNGLDEETCRERHEARLKELEEIRAEAGTR